MLISKFNRVIRNKILWGAFAILVSLSFTIYIGPEGGCSDDNTRDRGLAGRIDEKPVPMGDFLKARFFELGMRERPVVAPGAEEALRSRTWTRMLALRAASGLGLGASDAEVAGIIHRDPSFQANGQFDRNRYRATVERQLRLDVGHFEDYLRQDVTLQKFNRVLQGMVWAPPSEIEFKLANLTDTFTVEQAWLRYDDFVGGTEVAPEAVRRFYDEHQDRFREPERLSVRYVEFPFSTYEDRTEIPPGDILTYYEAHIDEFTVTNAVSGDAAATNTPAGADGIATNTPGVGRPLPLADVSDRIVAVLRRERGVAKARDAATEFAISLLPTRRTAGKPFDQAVAEMNLTIRTSAFFSVTETVPGLDVGFEFNREAFRLNESAADGAYSDAVVGRNAVYVLTPADKRPSFVPPFEDVVEKATDGARTTARRAAFEKGRDRVRDLVAAAMGKGESFAAALRAQDINVVTSAPFSVFQGVPEDLELAEDLVRRIMPLSKGETTGWLPVGKDFVIAHVADRKLGDFSFGQMLRPQLAATLNRHRAELLRTAWAEHAVASGRLQDLTQTGAETEEDESDDSEKPPLDS